MHKRKAREEDIFPSSRTLSKAVRSAAKGNSGIPDGIFEQLMKRSGYVLGYDGNSNELEVDQAVFQRDLGKLLRTHLNYPTVIRDFVQGVEKHIEDTKRLKVSLIPTATSVNCKSARDVCQDSLIHLLLGIEVLQEDVSDMLIEKTAEVAVCVDEPFDRKTNKSIPCMIISQFRWLNKLVNSEKMSSKMLELIEATELDVQKDIISLLPDIISDCDHPKVAQSLSKFLLQDKRLSVAILDTLSNLNLSPENLSQVRKQVLKTLSAVHIQELPISVKFVLQNLGPQDAPEAIHSLRNQLDLTSSFDPISTSTPFRKSGSSGSGKQVSVRIVDTIKLALKFQKSLCDSWLKVIELLSTPNKHRCLDFLVLLVIHSLGTHKRSVETLFRNKIKCGDLNEDLLQITFRYLTEILKDYLPTLLVLSEILLRSYEPVISQFGSLMYQKSFISFDTCNRQEIIGNLVTNVGNGPVHEVDAALNTLLTLAEQCPEKMVAFGTFIKNTLDHLDSLSLGQIRKVYSVLSILAYRGGREGSLLKDDMFIIVRKQLSNNNARYHKMGVIGALMAIKSASFSNNRSEDAGSTSLTDSESIREENFGEAMSLLELVLKSTFHSPEGLAVFCDELFHIVHRRQMGKNVEEWIRQKVLADFQDLFVQFIHEETAKEPDPEKEYKYGLDELTDDSPTVNLYALVNNWNKTKSNRGTFNTNKLLSPMTLSPYFRLLRVCQQHQEGGSALDDIESLLGCPISLPKFSEERFENVPMKEKHLQLNVMFFVINWFREVINAFAPVEDGEIRFKVCQRIKLLVELQDLALKYLQEVRNYEPPIAIFDCDEADADQMKAALASVSQKSSGKGKKPKQFKKVIGGKGSKEKSAISSQTTQDTEIITQKSTQLENNTQKSDDKGNKTSSFSSANSLQLYLRELDMEVFVLLQLRMIIKATGFTHSSEGVIALSPCEMKFLLEDLTNKLQHSLAASSSILVKMRMKSIGFSNLEMNSAVEIAAFTIKLLPAFCQILEDCSSYYQSMVVQHSESVIDPLVTISEESENILSCMQHVFHSISILFSWKGLGTAAHLSHLKEAMQALGTRLDKLPESAGLQELTKHAVSYLCKFKDSITLLLNATALVKLIESVVKFSTTDEQRRLLVSIAEDFLQHEWPELVTNKLKASQLNEHIQVLLEAYIRHSENIMATLEYLANEAVTPLMDPEGISEDDVKFKTLNKSTFSCYYKVMLNYLVENMKIYCAAVSTDKGDEFLQWTKAVGVFHRLVNLIKVFDGKSNLNACLKFGRHFIEMFLRYGMPLIDKLFLTKREDCLGLLKNLQMSTRFLQHVCSHSKVMKDIALTNQVPALKKALESFVYRVKAMLALNKCGDAFWLGNLKNRDLKGEEILSQSTNQDGDESSEGVDEEDRDEMEVDGDGDVEVENVSRSSQNEASDGSEEF